MLKNNQVSSRTFFGTFPVILTPLGSIIAKKYAICTGHMFHSSLGDYFHEAKSFKNTHQQFTGLILAPRYLGAKISTQDICLVYTKLSASAPASAWASPWSNRSYFIFQEECRSLPKTWEPNGWAGRGRGVVGADLKGNPFVGRIRGTDFNTRADDLCSHPSAGNQSPPWRPPQIPFQSQRAPEHKFIETPQPAVLQLPPRLLHASLPRQV